MQNKLPKPWLVGSWTEAEYSYSGLGKAEQEIKPMSCIFPDGVVKDRVCKEIWLGNNAATLEKLPGVDTVVEHGLKPTGYSADISSTGKNI